MKVSSIVIANSPSLLNKKNGDIIDSFKNVVRINNFQIKNYEIYTGIKTNSWVINEHFIRHRGSVSKNHIDNVLPKTYFLFPFDGYSDYDNLINILKINNDIIVIPREISYELSQRYDPTYKTWPSTGICALWYFKPCAATGFDFFKDGPDHYYGPRVYPQSGHSSEREELFFLELERDGLITVI